MVEPQAGTGIAGLVHILLDWFAGNKALTGWLIFLSVALSVVYAVLTYRAVGKISPDYFVTPEPRKGGWRKRHPVQRWVFRVSKNILGGLVFLAGVAMLVLPGQGMLTILLGLSLLDFPGKRKLELKIVRLRGVKRMINWIRAKAGAAALILPPKVREKTGIEAVLLRGLGLAVLGMGAPLLLYCFVVGGPAAEWTFTLVSLLFPAAFLALGLAHGRVRRRWLWSLAIFVTLFESIGLAILWLSTAGPGMDSIWHLPLATVLMMIGMGLVPLIAVGLIHAIGFEDFGLNPDEWRRVSAFKRRD
jgi:hypothetical protein